MNLIKKITVDSEGYVRTMYLCDGQEILPETYYSLEADIEEADLCDYDCDNCIYEECIYDEEDEPCHCVECIIERYTEKIANLGLVCPHCVREALESMVEEILD